MNERGRELLARLGGYFWLPCPICGQMFAGYEIGEKSVVNEFGNSMVACERCDDIEEAK